MQHTPLNTHTCTRMHANTHVCRHTNAFFYKISITCITESLHFSLYISLWELRWVSINPQMKMQMHTHSTGNANISFCVSLPSCAVISLNFDSIDHLSHFLELPSQLCLEVEHDRARALRILKTLVKCLPPPQVSR